MKASTERRLATWMVVLLWALWVCAAGVFVAVWFWIFWAPCTSDGSPGQGGYLSAWPFGPGCRTYFDAEAGYAARPRPPEWGWTAVLAGLVLTALSLAGLQSWMRRQDRSEPSRSSVECSRSSRRAGL
jgi:hypothetical protein